MERRPTERDIRDVYRATIDDLYDLVARRCHGDHDLAEDITQETWLRAVGAPANESAARRSLLQRALDQLPRAQARLLEAFHFEQRSVSDIASSDGLSERAVEGRLRRARVSLRRQIETEETTGDEQ